MIAGMRQRAWLVVVLLASGCNDTRHDAPSPVVTSVPPGAPQLGSFGLPDAVGLPAPYDKLRPFMLRSEVLTLLNKPPRLDKVPSMLADLLRGPTVFAGPHDTYLKLDFDRNDRLQGVAFVDHAPGAFVEEARANWKRGKVSALDASFDRVETWSIRGAWTVSLGVGRSRATAYSGSEEVARLAYVADPDATDVPPQRAPSVASIGKLLGRPMSAATELFGTAMHLEVRATDASRAEADPDQGYARVTFPFADDPWEVTLHVEAQRIVRVRLVGAAVDTAARRALMKTLEEAFGARRPLVGDTGDPQIGFGASNVVAVHDGGAWQVELLP